MRERYAIIMAGGSGTRFWPESRRKMPKQLLDLLGSGRSLLRSTFLRTADMVPKRNVYVVTGEVIGERVMEILPELPVENILREPMGRNTAPCIGWATNRIAARSPEALVGVFPSDHTMGNDVEFSRIIAAGFDRLEKEDRIITIGIKPDRPETGYGYVEGGESADGEIRKVIRFVEKPDAATAEAYLEAGSYYWNGGIFLFRAGRMAREIRERLPDIHRTLQGMQEAFLAGGAEREARVAADIFPGIEGISIDYGVMEKASDVEVIPGDFGWSDLGSWRAIYEKLEKDGSGNAVRGGGTLLVHDAKGILASVRRDKMVAVVGVDNVVVVDTDDALMVCSLDRDQEVREIVSALKKAKDDRI